ncbi:O18ab/O18ac family O-antigen polymerase [Escherichia coli]
MFSLLGTKSRITSPLPLHFLPWLLTLIVGISNYDQFYEFNEKSFYSLLIWFTVIFIFYFIGELVNYKRENINVYYGLSHIEYECKKYWIIVIPISLYTIFEIYMVGMGGADGFFLNLRLANTLEGYMGKKFILMPAVYPLMMAMFAIVCLTKTSKLNKYSIYFWMLLYCIGTMGKFSILTPILTYLIIYDFKHRLKVKKTIKFTSLLIIILALTLHFTRMAENDHSTFLSILGLYIYSPIIALGQLNEVNSSHFGEYTFRFIYAITNKIGLIKELPVNTILDYSYVPVPTNVYTALQPFYQDFGYTGIIFGAVLYGLIYVSLYTAGVRGNNTQALLIYALFSVSSATAFFAETLVTNLAGNVKLVLCTILLWRFTVICKPVQ